MKYLGCAFDLFVLGMACVAAVCALYLIAWSVMQWL